MERINDYREQSELTDKMRRDHNNIRHNHIVIAEYDQAWTDSFHHEVNCLQRLMGDILVQAHHIGSTSVPGLAAKPVIDLLLEVTDVRELDDLQSTIIASGYQFWGEYGLPGRRYLTKGIAPRTHNIHSYASGNSELDRHLAFRDYLLAHPDVASDYESLKRHLAAECNHDIDKYCEGKDTFIKHHQRLALEYVASQT